MPLTDLDELHEYIRHALLPEVHVSFEFFAKHQHLAAWTDVQAKAKRLVQSGKVTILRNAPHHIMAHVVGDGTDNGGTPDEHEVEITRSDPSTSIIEQWNCTCKWAQYAFDRTRKWKKFEGRVCSHVLATYWKAKSTPLDMTDAPEGYQTPRGQKGAPAGPGQQSIPGLGDAVPSATDVAQPPTAEGEAPAASETPEAQQPQGVPQLPSNQDITLPGQPQNPFAPPKQVKQKPQLQQMHLFDITAPPGGQPVPPMLPVSVPGGRPPTPANPVQLPGTFSHWIPVAALRTSEFVYAEDSMTKFFETERQAGRPIYVTLVKTVALEQSGGKIPMPGAQPIGTSSEGVSLYRVMDLGWNPATRARENADVNQLQGAPEQSGVYSDVEAGRRGEVLDWDPTLRMAYVFIPLHYPDKGTDARLHPHAMKGWVDFSDLRVTPGANPFRVNR